MHGVEAVAELQDPWMVKILRWEEQGEHLEPWSPSCDPVATSAIDCSAALAKDSAARAIPEDKGIPVLLAIPVQVPLAGSYERCTIKQVQRFICSSQFELSDQVGAFGHVHLLGWALVPATRDGIGVILQSVANCPPLSNATCLLDLNCRLELRGGTNPAQTRCQVLRYGMHYPSGS